MSYCINFQCKERQNPDHLKCCRSCHTPLQVGVAQQYRLLAPLHLNNSFRSTEVFVAEGGGARKIIKVLLPQNRAQVERFEREALLLQILQHPGIPRSDLDDYFIVTPPGSAFELHCIAMEFVEGKTLQEWVEKNRSASQAQILDWLTQLTDILKVVHTPEFDYEHSYVHCDIKPDNIMLRPDGQLSLIDFGLVTIVGEDIAKVTAGTAGYIAPEQIDGTPVPQSDFYSLGRTMIYLATGVPLNALPHDLKTGQLVWRTQAPQIDKPLAELLDQLVSPALGVRPLNASQLLEALGQIPEEIRKLRRQRLLPYLYGAVGIAVVIVSFMSYRWVMAGVNYRLGLESQIQRQLENSRKYLEKSIELNSSSIDTYNSLALTCQLQGDNICAIQQHQKALSLDPASWKAYNGLANVFDALGEYSLAENQYILAMKYNRERTALAISNLSRLKNRAKQYNEAAELAQQGLEQTSDLAQQAVLLKNQGWAELGLGLLQQADGHLQASLQKEKEALQEQTNNTNSQEALRADAYCLLAQVQEAKQQVKQAKHSWKQCLQHKSENPEVEVWRNQFIDRVFQHDLPR